MNSEKVKEIKKALENNANYEHYNKLGYIDGYTCKVVAYADILTYINELEKEVEDRKAEVLHLQEYGKKLIRETELKQFAKKLKEKSFYIKTIDNNYNVVELSTVDAILREYEK